MRYVFSLLLLVFSSAAFALGGDFKLTDQNGSDFRLSSFSDKVIVMFFGYTHCPDICPDTLSVVTSALNQIEDVSDVQVVFVSVDPSRDTPLHLKSYLAYFDESYIGLSGTWQQTKQVADLWNARFSTPESPTTDSYFVDHSADIYVIERGGKVHGVVPYGLPADHLSKVVQGALSLNTPIEAVHRGLLDQNDNPVVIGADGRPAVLHFWASWCAPCRTEFSDLEAAKQQISALPASFYAINLGDRKKGIDRFLQDFPLSLAVLRDTNGSSAERWQVNTLPQTIVVSSGGAVLARLRGAQQWTDKQLQRQLNRLLLQTE